LGFYHPKTKKKPGTATARDGDGEVRLRDPRPEKKKKKKNKPWVSGETQRDPARRAPARSSEVSASETLRCSFFFLFSFFFDRLLHGSKWFCAFFFLLAEVSTSKWWEKREAFLPRPN
jgi:hypothetical protein